jgi:hypothetical protein
VVEPTKEEPTKERLEELCRNGYEALREGPGSDRWRDEFEKGNLLHPKVELYDYDHGAHFVHVEGKAEVLERLEKVIHPEFEEFGDPQIEVFDGMVVIWDCSKMKPGHGDSFGRRKKNAGRMPEDTHEDHCCMDVVKFEGAQVREIHYCVVSKDVLTP